MNHLSHSDGLLWDEEISLSRAGLPVLFQELDVLFGPYRQAPIACLGLMLENTVIMAVAVWYLLERNISFFLASGHLSPGGSFPRFCDLILSKRESSHPEEKTAGLRLYRNEGWTSSGDLSSTPGNIIFSSSGTTGKAKYICFKKEALLQNARNCVERLGLTEQSRILLTVPAGHMYGMGVGLLPAMAAGASLCLIERNNVIKFMDSANRFRPTITLITPAFAKMLLKLNKPAEARSLYITAGEKLSPTAYRAFESLLGPLYNLYGCTEMGAIAVSPPEENLSMYREEGLVRALSSVEVVIDGETHGPILCRHPAGYSSYIGEEGNIVSVPNSMEGWYKTMDMGEAAGGGCFYVRGRLDNCINRSGFLVSLDEIAAVLERILPGVSQAVVLNINGPEAAEDKLLAICEAAGHGRPEGPALKRICRENMNKYQIPDEFHFVGSLPRLQNGKPDRAAMIRDYTNH